jgi:hypothetical protein
MSLHSLQSKRAGALATGARAGNQAGFTVAPLAATMRPQAGFTAVPLAATMSPQASLR